MVFLRKCKNMKVAEVMFFIFSLITFKLPKTALHNYNRIPIFIVIYLYN